MKDWNRSPEPPSMMGPVSFRSAAERPFEIWPGSPTSPTTTKMTSVATATPSSPSCNIRPRSKLDVSLAEMARRCIMQKIHLFDTFGNTPFPIVRPILEQCQAKKLLALEEASPHFSQSTGYIWKRLCIKDFKDIAQACQSNTLPEATDWRALHIQRQSAQQEALEAAAARIKEKYASLEASRVANRVRVVTATSPTVIRGNKMGIKPKSTNLTSGQKLLRDARKQGSVRSQMTQGIRKTAPPPPSPTQPITKKPRLEVEARPPSPTKTLAHRQNGILITKIPGTARRY